MNMPNVSISFSEVASSAVERGERGIVALILKDKIYKDQAIEILTVNDIPKTMTDFNKKQIKTAMIGYINAPKKIIAYIMDADAEEVDYTKALEYFEVNKFNYLAVPSVVDDQKESDVVSWIKSQRDSGRKVKAILPNTAGDSDGIINYTTEWVTDDNADTFTTAEYCSRVAGIIAGTPLRISCTYATLPELTDCSKLKKELRDKAVSDGEFIVWWDGEKVKTGRAVTSLTTTTSEKGDKFKKIKIVEAIDLIYEDIKRTVEDSYIGKYENSYNNKGLLISAILGYMETLTQEKVLGSYTVDIDTEANRAYLMANGGQARLDDGTQKKVEDCSDDEIKKADTGSNVFLEASLTIYDTMEDISMKITI